MDVQEGMLLLFIIFRCTSLGGFRTLILRIFNTIIYGLGKCNLVISTLNSFDTLLSLFDTHLHKYVTYSL